MDDVSENHARRTWSRRAIIAAPVAVGAGALGLYLTRDRGPQSVRPLAAQVVHEGYGVCQHVNFESNVYQHQTAILDRYGEMAVAQMR